MRELDTKIQDQETRFHLQLIYVISLKTHKRILPKMYHNCTDVKGDSQILSKDNIKR